MLVWEKVWQQATTDNFPEVLGYSKIPFIIMHGVFLLVHGHDIAELGALFLVFTNYHMIFVILDYRCKRGFVSYVIYLMEENNSARQLDALYLLFTNYHTRFVTLK